MAAKTISHARPDAFSPGKSLTTFIKPPANFIRRNYSRLLGRNKNRKEIRNALNKIRAADSWDSKGIPNGLNSGLADALLSGASPRQVLFSFQKSPAFLSGSPGKEEKNARRKEFLKCVLSEFGRENSGRFLYDAAKLALSRKLGFCETLEALTSKNEAIAVVGEAWQAKKGGRLSHEEEKGLCGAINKAMPDLSRVIENTVWFLNAKLSNANELIDSAIKAENYGLFAALLYLRAVQENPGEHHGISGSQKPETNVGGVSPKLAEA